MAKATIRIDLEGKGSIGPGKVRLLELIAESGSIAAAARTLGMSYRQAWLLVASLNDCFGAEMTVTQTGGRDGGRTDLTPTALKVAQAYRAIEKAAIKSADKHLAALEAMTHAQPTELAKARRQLTRARSGAD
jgi:molybdate transport system regulatory protein